VKDYRVDLEAYNGPLDLLLFLIRREEVDIYDIPIARITEQYMAYVGLLESLDPNLVGDFLVLAATLMEIKSRMLLPRPPVVEEEDDIGDPRLDLVRQLLEYKRFKDAARRLGVAAEIQALKHPRNPVPLHAGPGEVDLEDVPIWDLLEAFRGLLEQTGRRAYRHEVVYDDTPLALHATDILDSLDRADGSLRFEAIFEGRTKSQLIGLFLALLELIRRKRIRAAQAGPFEPIVLHLLDASPIGAGFDNAYEQPRAEAGGPSAETGTESARVNHNRPAAEPTETPPESLPDTPTADPPHTPNRIERYRSDPDRNAMEKSP
jgi:segregation and condensation protein A